MANKISGICLIKFVVYLRQDPYQNVDPGLEFRFPVSKPQNLGLRTKKKNKENYKKNKKKTRFTNKNLEKISE